MPATDGIGRRASPNTTARALYASIFPNVEPSSTPLRLPQCARHLTVFVYDIPPTFHIDLLNTIERRRGKANCDWARSPCIERTREPVYSSLRQYSAELPLLAKLLSMPQAAAPEDADLIVVPWLASTELSAQNRPWYPNNPLAVASFKALSEHLVHFHGSMVARHLFLSSRDWTFTNVPLREMITATSALLATYGPSRPGRRNEVLVAPNDAGFGRPLTPLRHPPSKFVFAMFDEKINGVRQDYGAELRRLRATYPHLRVSLYPIVDHTSLALDPEQTHAAMSDSLLCPIIQGDLPYQHRLFDALACGCVPLLLRYASSPSCATWSWDARNRSVQKGATKVTIPETICLADTLPYQSSIDWESITVQIDASDLRAGRLAESIAALDQEAIGRRRRILEQVRRSFVYDWSGNTQDAFSAAMKELCRVLPARGRPGANDARRYRDRGDLPV